MKVKNNNYIVLGGSHEQFDYIKYLKDNLKNLNIICCDKNPKAYCKFISDKFLSIDIKNKKKILNLSKNLNIIGISSHISEHAIETINYVSKKLNLPSTSKLSVKATKSKYFCKKFLNEKNHYVKLNKFKFNIIKKINKNSQVVIKPDESSGQKNLYKIEKNSKPEIIKKKFFLSKNTSKNRSVVIERFIVGEEINVVCLIVNKNIYKFIYSLRKRYTGRNGFGVVYRHEYNYLDHLKINNKIKSIINKIIIKLKLNNAIIYPQLILDEYNNLNLLEYGERIPGGKMRELFEYATGIDLLNAQFQISTKKKNLKIKKNIKKYKYISVDFVNGSPGPLKPGNVKKIKTTHFYKKHQIVDENVFLPNQNKCIKIKKIKSSADRFYYFLSASNSFFNFKENIKYLVKNIKVVDYENRSLKRKNFYKYIL